MSESNEYIEYESSEYEASSDMPYLKREDATTIPASSVGPGHFESYNIVYERPVSQFPPSRPFSTQVPSTRFSRDYFGNTPLSQWSEKKPAKTIRKPQSGKRKPCNCTRSQCLKLYCDCFANGEFCLNCNCKDCHNNMEFTHERSRAIKQTLEKNPQAFNPKIGVATKGDMERLHQKGCHCKKSNCLKNYCECYEAKVACTDRCKCKCCRNTEADRQVRFSEKFPIGNEFDRTTPVSDEEPDQPDFSKNVKAHPWHYLTDDVIEATTTCLVAQAYESEQRQDSQVDTIKALCGEFGRCLGQVFDAIRIAQENEVRSAKKEFINPSDVLQ